MRNVSKRTIHIVVSAAFLILPLSGCGRKTVKVDPAAESVRVADTIGAQPSDKAKPAPDNTDSAKAATQTAANSGVGAVESLETPPPGQGGIPGVSGAAETTALVDGSRTNVGLVPIYFDYDKSIVRPDQVTRIETDARYLKDNPAVRLRIEGNCDARGTNEYNMALGERRAVGAMKYLINLGIAANRLSTLSYGEERPLNPGNDEAAWAENRMGDFVIVR